MKILQIIPQLSSGGGERFTVDLCNELSLNHDVTLMVLLPLEGDTAFYLPQVSSRVKVVTMNKHRGPDLKMFFAIYKYIKQLNPNVIHTHLRAITYAAFSFFKCHRKCKCIHTVHNAAKQEAGEFVGQLIRSVLFKHKIVLPITISEDSNLSFQEFYGMSAPLINNGRNIPKDITPSCEVFNEVHSYKHSENTILLVHLARFTAVKRQSMMAHIADKLYNEGYDIALIMIGYQDYDEAKKVKDLASPCVHMLGQRTNPLDYLMLADAFVLCSTYEGMPISLIEALGVGTVPICTPVGGIVNAIENRKNGFLSVDISEGAYYNALKEFLDLPNQRRIEMKAAARESYKAYSMTECANKYLDIYQD